MEPQARPVTVEGPDRPLNRWNAYRAARRNVLELIPKAAYRERLVHNGAGTGSIMLVDPDGIEAVLRSRADDYPRSRAAMRIMTPRRGHNIVSASGEAWRSQRKAMVPTFQPRALAAHAPKMTAAADITSAHIANQGDDPFDIFPLFLSATRDVICDLALSGESLDREALSACIDRGLGTVMRFSLLDALRVPPWVPRPDNLKDTTRVRLDRMADKVLRERRRRGPAEPPDLLDALIAAANGEHAVGLEGPTIRNNLVALLFAGHETTALALGWALYLLALDKAVQDRAAGLAGDVLGERAATVDDLSALGAIRQIVEEALRLYPPAAMMSRRSARDDTLAGEHIPAGTTILIPVYALHRHHEFWVDPDAFAPERFDAGRADRPRFSYLPFGAGPRICIGAEFAMMEATIILSTLLARWRFTLAAGFTPLPRMWFTLRPANGVVVRAARR